MTHENDRTAKIAALNDDCRRHCEMPGLRPGTIVLTHGVTSLGNQSIRAILNRVANFNDFSKDNDPYGEHDFGSIDFNGQKLFWKFDYYDGRMKFGSEDPSDPAQTTRVLTIMLAEEY